MRTSFALLFFTFALAGLAFAGYGALGMLSVRRLEGRLSRFIAPTAPSSPTLARFMGLIVARGRDRTEIEDKLREAGFQDPRAMERFLWLRLGATVGVVLLFALASYLISGSLFRRPLLLIIAGGGAYLASKRLLKLFATARLRAITSELPFFLDLMLMMLESGISLDQCFRTIAQEETGAAPLLTQSVQALVADLDRGMDYGPAIDRWVNRLGVSGTRELGSLFQQGLFQGVELTPPLRQFVREFTERRVGSAREAMGKISVKMTVVMMLFFMPALLIVMGAPPFTSLLDNLGEMAK